jgi:hypothetical protein
MHTHRDCLKSLRSWVSGSLAPLAPRNDNEEEGIASLSPAG